MEQIIRPSYADLKREMRGGQSIYFRDPDDLLVELATPGIWEAY
jgi:catechol 2,3-dioxygenase-like lactoylglutathione lyase family enzyme